MIEIRVPKEITDYKQKFLFGLTVRQFVSVVLALGICVPLYIFGKEPLGEDIISWLIIIIAAPIFCFGFLKFNDMPFEKFAMLVIRQILEPQKRKYVELPVFWSLRNILIEEEILHQTERNKRNLSEAQRFSALTLAKPQKPKFGDLPIYWDLRQELVEEEILHQIELNKRKERDNRGKRKRT